MPTHILCSFDFSPLSIAKECKNVFSLANIFMRLLWFCATPLNLPSWSLFFLVVVEVTRPSILVSWVSSAVLLDILCQCVWLIIMTHWLLHSGVSRIWLRGGGGGGCGRDGVGVDDIMLLSQVSHFENR